MPRQHKEHDLQSQCFDWVRAMVNGSDLYDRIFAIPNGEYRPISVAKRLWREGVKAGVTDIIIFYPSRGFHGAAIEMKAPGERPTPEQDAFLLRAKADGYYAAVSQTFENFRKRVRWYFEEIS